MLNQKHFLLLVLVLSLGLLLSGCNGGPGNYEIEFECDNFEDLVRGTIAYRAVPIPEDEPIYRNDVKNLTHINVRDADLEGNITSLEGVQSFIKLESIILGDGQNISDISPLGELTNLERISLRNNSITDISALSGLNNLDTVFLGQNDITDISVLENCTELRQLSLFRNENLADISPLEQLTNLELIAIGYCNVKDLTPLANNTGLGEGDRVEVHRNPYDKTENSEAIIEELRDRGVRVKR